MSTNNRIKKKFIDAKAIDGSKLLFLNNESFKAVNHLSVEQSLFKLDSAGKFVFETLPEHSFDPSTADQLARKAYVDAGDLAEQSARVAADDLLQSAIDALEAQTSADLAAEVSARIAGDEALAADLADEVDILNDALNSISMSLAEEQSARAAADSDLDGRLDVLEGSDTTAGSVAKALKDAKDYTDAEQARAESAEAGLQSQISTEKGRVDAILLAADADKDSFAEIVALINSIDTDSDSAFATAISNEASARAAADAAEASARAAADAVLQSAIDAEASARAAADTALNTRLTAVESFKDAQILFVSKSGSDVSGTGGQHNPFASVGAALAAITDASPTKRYLIKVLAGAYTEGAIALKANVFICGDQKEAVRISASSFALASDFSGSGDHRSGMSKLVLAAGNCNFDWSSVTSAAGKLYFSEVSINGTVNLYGHNNAIAQAQFDSCLFFNTLTISGINVGVFNNNICYGNISLNQHPNGGMATILAATGGQVSGTVTLTTTVNDFNRRCSLFAKNFYMEYVTVNGASSYADMNEGSLPRSHDRIVSQNGGNIVYITTNAPHASGARNLGEAGKQYSFTFSYVHASSDTDLYVISMGADYSAASAGRSIFLEADSYGLATNVDGGDVTLNTATTSGTGVRGKIKLDGRLVDVSGKKVVDLAAGTDATDAVNKGQLDAVSSAVSAEASARAAADAVLQSAIDAEASARIAGDLAEQSARVAADAVLQSAIDAEASARAAADSDLDGRLDVLEADPTTKTYVDGKVALLNSSIDDVDGYAQDIRDDLDQEILDRAAAVSAEASARIAGDLAEQSARVAADAVLQSAIDTEKGRVDAILLAADADKDSFAEIVALINSVDTANDSAFASYVLSNDAALATEVSARAAGDAAEASARVAADAVLQSAIDAEASARAAADAAEASARAAADTAEASARAAADTALQGEIDAEASARIAGDLAEQSARVAADAAEASARAAADTALQGEIDAEELARANADGVLQNNIDSLGDRFAVESFDIPSQLSTPDSILLANKAFEFSMVVSVGRLMLLPGVDYFVVVNPGMFGNTTRVVFTPSFMGGAEAPSEGDRVVVRYLKDVR